MSCEVWKYCFRFYDDHVFLRGEVTEVQFFNRTVLMRSYKRLHSQQTLLPFLRKNQIIKFEVYHHDYNQPVKPTSTMMHYWNSTTTLKLVLKKLIEIAVLLLLYYYWPSKTTMYQQIGTMKLYFFKIKCMKANKQRPEGTIKSFKENVRVFFEKQSYSHQIGIV